MEGGGRWDKGMEKQREKEGGGGWGWGEKNASRKEI